jgi:hypothetical protein
MPARGLPKPSPTPPRQESAEFTRGKSADAWSGREIQTRNWDVEKWGGGEGGCAADFSLLNLPKVKSLGRSKPATNSYAQAPQHTVWKTSTISKPYW